MRHDFRNSIGYWIGSVARANEQVLNAALAPHQITIRQVQVLACLALRDSATQTELAEMIGIEAPTIVRVLDRMERARWIARHPAPGDRRRNIIRATGKADAIWKTIVAVGTGVEKRSLVGISAAELKVTQKVLERMLRNLEEGK